jgi:hypothetical protein
MLARCTAVGLARLVGVVSEGAGIAAGAFEAGTLKKYL